MATLNLNLVVFAVIIVAYINFPATVVVAVNHIVGDDNGWVAPEDPKAPNPYDMWSKAEKFSKGDVLVFNFVGENHTVAEVPKAAYDACNVAAAKNVTRKSPVNVPLTTAGVHYFICTLHCASGQKLAVHVK